MTKSPKFVIPELPVERFLIAPFGRAGHARSACAGDAVTVEMWDGAPTRRRVIVAPRCEDAEHGGDYLCISCAQVCANHYQLDAHASVGVHFVAQWCASCQRWETCVERPAGERIGLRMLGGFV